MKKKKPNRDWVSDEIKQLAKVVARFEGKKHQASYGDVEEILGILSDIGWHEPRLGYILALNGRRRAAGKARAIVIQAGSIEEAKSKLSKKDQKALAFGRAFF